MGFFTFTKLDGAFYSKRTPPAPSSNAAALYKPLLVCPAYSRLDIRCAGPHGSALACSLVSCTANTV